MCLVVFAAGRIFYDGSNGADTKAREPGARVSSDALLGEFDRRLRIQPDRILLAGGSRTCSAADLHATSRWVSNLLSRHGVPAGACLGVRAPNGQGFLALLLGVLRHPAVPVLLDSQTPDAEAHRIMTVLGAVGLAGCRAAWPEHPDDFGFQAFTGDGEVRLAEPGIIKLTSGSTGEPRGIETPLPALLADEENLAATMGIKESDRILAAVPLAHSYGLSSLAVPTLVRGTMLIIPEAGNPFSPLQAAVELDATVFPTTPPYLEGLVQWEGDLPSLDSLRLLISAGAPLRPETARRIHRSWGHRVHAFYGASECGGIAYDPEGSAAEEGLVGQAVRHVSIELENVPGQEAPGRHLVIRSPAVARRYLPCEDPRLGAGRFESDDLGVLEHGSLRLQGRLGPVVKIRGKKVHPAEVEHILTQMPGIREAYVHSGGVTSAGRDILEALVVPEGKGLSRRAITAWCRGRLAPEKIPRRILLVAELPRSERGKIEFRRVLGLRA